MQLAPPQPHARRPALLHAPLPLLASRARAAPRLRPPRARLGPPMAQPAAGDEPSARLRRQLADEYARAAPTYDSRWSAYTKATVGAALAALPPLPPDSRVLDLACGTGALLHGLADAMPPRAPLRSYVGLDNSAAMLDAAQRAAAAAPPPFAVRWVAGAADEALPLADASVDAVLCANSFHFFGAPATCLSEAARVLKPGGVLLLADWSADFLSCRLLEWWLRRRGAPTARVLRAGELRALLAAAPALRVESLTTRRLRTWWGFMVLVARKQA
jgi:ubiquinone/menaquinone biosynthesis C-methylase UbiE